jgi:hypothetical protein
LYILILDRKQAMPKSAIPPYIISLIRHFEDLRDGTHGGSATRKDKEAHFEMNTSLLLDTGKSPRWGYDAQRMEGWMHPGL